MFDDIYKNKKILITGHTGFKGSWLALWLKELGADLIGLALDPVVNPNHFQLLDLVIKSIIGDIRNFDLVTKVINNTKPDIVFHLAAQAIVQESYEIPRETYETNVMGTLNIFEACRKLGTVKAIVNITSDKCYENREQIWGYREIDAMGGYDPYSSSKGCSELLTSSYRNSFFNIKTFGSEHNTLLASARAGNVIGGGDWANFRLVPDIMKAISKNKIVEIRSPKATRPWQHVLEPLSGYLLLGQKLLLGKKEFASGWNFGPLDEGTITVKEVVNHIQKYWSKIEYRISNISMNEHEANLLKLDCSKALHFLDWKPVWNSEETFMNTTNWYKEYYTNNSIQSMNNLQQYFQDAKRRRICWA